VTDDPPRRAGRWALAVLLAGALSACLPVPAPPSPASTALDVSLSTSSDVTSAPGAVRLLAAIGTPGAMRLVWLDGHPDPGISVPSGDLRWIAGDPVSSLVATVGPLGRVFVSGPDGRTIDPSWRELPVDEAARRWLGLPLTNAVPDPGGGTVVAVAADPAAGTDGHLAILDPSGGPTRILSLHGQWDGRAPAWLGPTRVAVSTRDGSDEPALAIVDLADGRSRRWGAAVGAFAVSGDGSTLAYQDRDDGRILAGAFDPDRDASDFAALPRDGSFRVAAQLLLDRTGRRLAVTWLDASGDTTAWAVYERTAAGWAVVRDEPVPRGVSRAILVSLGP
jgi:hypothetical protein